ncbi:ATP-binding protein [Candidatus Parabeggiatoa sp. HSG14]|uniref:sensor histidine kinase n=1 Tax=Candidatus Parabeggiatoa sp. HSG14 TaxID=3055593 RepID=UPI0025A7D459|nr:ATP-binding protein [Thiotrichales bacterium HSG14]
MSLATVKIKKGLNIGTALVLGALLVSLLMIADALQNSERFEHLYSSLLLINAIALLALLAVIGLNLRRLFHQVHEKKVGAGLTVRLVGLLIVLSIVPVIVVYYFSLEFLHQRLDHWFDVNIEQALTDALDLNRAALDGRMLEALKKTKAAAYEISLVSEHKITLQLHKLCNRKGASEFTLLKPNGHIIASNSTNIENTSHPQEDVLLQFKQSNSESYINLEPIVNKGLHIRVVVKIPQSQQMHLLQALYPIPARLDELAKSVEIAFGNYQKKAYLQQPLKLSFTLVLSLVLLLSILGAVWIAFFAAHRFVAPLSHLVEGTHAVAQGNYEKQLPVKHLDELGFLVQSFNEMTRKIAQARDEVKKSQRVADSQRAYLEAVLERLSSGVISLNREQRLRTANPAAAQILGLPLEELLGKTLTQLQENHSTLLPLCYSIHPHLFTHAQDWREEITLFGTNGRKILMCQGTELWRSQSQKQPEGYVIVFDDITTLIQAQRSAAWSEVARRLAHEIKNPLTPIQLSAERLRHKYLHKLPDKDVAILDRMTHTIIQQVEVMKEMVNAFSDYARSPSLVMQPLNLNQLIEEVLGLYQQIPINTLFEQALPNIKADHGRLRQVLHNLIKNALEAKPTDNSITISTRYLADSCFECIELRLSDRGPGIPKSLLDKIFEPYVTTKTKGTGLGLAIVKKIIDEHSGTVWIEQVENMCVVIRLPVMGGRCKFNNEQCKI